MLRHQEQKTMQEQESTARKLLLFTTGIKISPQRVDEKKGEEKNETIPSELTTPRTMNDKHRG
jgi:hypothetical protein